jgi:gamma-polyglutamate biosynthesis protein CapA
VADGISIIGVGDIMLGDHPVRIGNGVRSQIERNGMEWLFSEVKHLFAGSDVVFGNLEVVHSDLGLKPNYLPSMEFRASPESVSAVRAAGFTVVGLANNHCMEHGRSAFLETVDRLTAVGVAVAGIRGPERGVEPYEMTAAGRKVVLLAFSMRPEAYSKEPVLPYCLADENEILQRVAEVRERADVLILSLHWGEEFMEYPSRSQVAFAHRLVDAGVNVILGHHPHVLQGVERYRGAVIAYSLGNFVFDMWQEETRGSMILRVQIGEDGAANYEIVPVHISDRFQPIPLEGDKNAKALTEIARLSAMIPGDQSDAPAADSGHAAANHGETGYYEIAARRTLIHRLGNYWYFIRHIHQYRRELVLQSLKRSISRRVEELNSRFRGDRAFL